jgi:hypothetical protein
MLWGWIMLSSTTFWDWQYGHIVLALTKCLLYDLLHDHKRLDMEYYRVAKDLTDERPIDPEIAKQILDAVESARALLPIVTEWFKAKNYIYSDRYPLLQSMLFTYYSVKGMFIDNYYLFWKLLGAK